MQDFEPIDIEFILNKQNVKQDADAIRKYIQGIAEQHEESAAKAQQQIEKMLKRLEQLEGGTKGKALPNTTKRFNALNNSVAQISRELPSFLYSAQTGFLAISNNIPILADEIARVKKENELLTASGKKGVPVWQQLTKSIFSWNTLLSVGITLVAVYGKEIAALVKGLFDSKKAIDENKQAAEALNKAFDDSNYQKAIGNILELKANIDLAKKGIIDKQDAINNYNEVLGEAAGKVNTLQEAEQGLIDKAPAYIEVMLLKAAAAHAQSEVAKELAAAAKEEQKLRDEIARAATNPAASQARNTGLGANWLGVNTNFTQDQLQAEVNDATNAIEESVKKREELAKRGEDIIKRFQQQAARIAESAGLDLFPDSGPEAQKKLDEREKLLEKIADLDREYALKQLDSNEAEVQALRDKFDKVRKLVEEFNSDPKNKNALISTDDLDAAQRRAEADLKYRHDTEALKAALDEQKAVYKEFEEYQEQFGIEAARKKYAAQIGEFETYAALLKSKINENQDAFAAVADGTATGTQAERVNELKNRYDAEISQNDRKERALLASLQSYETKRNILVQNYADKRLKLSEKASDEELATFDKNFQQVLDELDRAHAESTDEYKALMNGVSDLSDKAAQEVIDNARKMVDSLVAAGLLSSDAAAEIRANIEKAQSALSKKEEDRMQSIANAFGEVSYHLSQATDDFTQKIGNLVGEMANTFATINDSNAGSLQKATSLVGIIVQAGQLIKDIGKEDYFSEVNAQKEVNQHLADQLDMEAKINEIRRERAEIERNSSAFLDSYYKDDFSSALNTRLESEEKLLSTMQKLAENGIFSATGKGKRLLFGTKTEDRDFTLQQILGDYYPTDYFLTSGRDAHSRFLDPLSIFGGYSDIKVTQDALKKLRTAFDDALEGMGKTSADMANFSATEWLDFYTILEDSGYITDEATQRMIANAKEASEEYQAAVEEMKSVIQDFGGDLGTQLGDSLVQAFKTGEDAAESFKANLNNILTQLFIQDLLSSQFKSYFDRLQKEMEASMGLGGDQSWLDDVERFGEEVTPQIQRAMDAIAVFDEQLKDMGYDGVGADSTSTQTGLTGAIQRELTEATGSELTGLYRNQLDIARRHFEIAEKAYQLDQRNFDNTVQMMRSTALIEENTRNTVVQLGYVVSRLDDIKNNTKQGQTARDLGL